MTYVPTDADICAEYAADVFSDGSADPWLVSRFNTWLAGHDARLRHRLAQTLTEMADVIGFETPAVAIMCARRIILGPTESTDAQPGAVP